MMECVFSIGVSLSVNRLTGEKRVGVWVIFFFQAEDGIRDLVRSRGLGDVYKRQPSRGSSRSPPRRPCASSQASPASLGQTGPASPTSVSYTHLTLPTSDLV